MHLKDLFIEQSEEWDPQTKALLTHYQILTYQDLLEEFEQPEIRSSLVLQKALREAIIKLEASKRYSFEPLVADGMSLEQKRSCFDTQRKASDLPFMRTNVATSRYYQHYSMKELLERSTQMITLLNGTSIPVMVYFPRNQIGWQNYPILMRDLAFYEAHRDKLLTLYQDVLPLQEMFTYKQEDKREGIKQQRLFIYTYLFEHGYEFLFGAPSLLLQEKILDTLSGRKRYYEVAKKLTLYDAILADYLLPCETKEVASPKILNRFIMMHGER